MRTRPARAALALCVPALCLLATACRFDDTSYQLDPRENNSQPLGQGRIFIAWTVGGRAPDAVGCGGIDHLKLRLDYLGSNVRVEPIPCALDRFRFDGLPEGSAQITLTAFTGAGCATARGIANVVVTETQPATPMPTVPLDAPRACP